VQPKKAHQPQYVQIGSTNPARANETREVSLLRRLRLVAPVQLPLDLPAAMAAQDRWWGLPEQARARVLVLLAALIAKGVLVEEEDGD
jgi:hypothetical protein